MAPRRDFSHFDDPDAVQDVADVTESPGEPPCTTSGGM